MSRQPKSIRNESMTCVPRTYLVFLSFEGNQLPRRRLAPSSEHTASADACKERLTGDRNFRTAGTQLKIEISGHRSAFDKESKLLIRRRHEEVSVGNVHNTSC